MSVSHIIDYLGVDKQGKLTQDYEDNSLWLRAQFKLIQDLIETNPRDQLVVADQLNNDPTSMVGQKRKSDENQRTGDSPEQKRSSSELFLILESEGLPGDLQRMKKEQLVNELVKRGRMEFSMKNLKNELIEGLKEVLLQTKQPDMDAEESNGVNDEDKPQENDPKEISESPPLNHSISEKSKLPDELASDKTEKVSSRVSVEDSSSRRSMVLNSIRSQVRESLVVEHSNAIPVNPRASVEQEFQARLLRHRESQAQKPSRSSNITEEEVLKATKNIKTSLFEKGKVSEQVVPVAELLVGHEESQADEVISSDEIVTEEIPEEVIEQNAVNVDVVPDKPLNLVSNQTSFLAVEKKPVIPALLKAEKLKEQEELKLAEKRKKDAERKVIRQRSFAFGNSFYLGRDGIITYWIKMGINHSIHSKIGVQQYLEAYP